MDPEIQEGLALWMRRHRDDLMHEAAATESECRSRAEGRDRERCATAQQEGAARPPAPPDRHAQHEIEKIDAALARIAAGRYGICVTCRHEIMLARLRLLPATPLCVRCARRHPPSGALLARLAAALVRFFPGPN